MPRPRICSVSGCPEIHEGPGSRCPRHTNQAKREHWRASAGYNTRGHRLRFRDAVLERDPICVRCDMRESVVADHYPKSRRELIDLNLDPDNPAYGRGLCVECHNAETAANQPGGWNAR